MVIQNTPGGTGLSERAQHFLKVLVERYILDGEPVGSRTLARDSGLSLSPATIRKVMADLEDMGLVASPHTSAGRIPTISGYRMFIDSLITLKTPEEAELQALRERLGVPDDSRRLIQSASQLLSGFTHMAGVVMVPRRDHVIFRQIEFLPLSGNKVLTILVTEAGEVHNRIIETRKVYSPAELVQAANVLNEHYAGSGLEGIHHRLVQEMDEARTGMNKIMMDALAMAEKVIGADEGRDDLVMAGQTNLMDFDELAQMGKLRQLFDSFTEKQELLHLLDESLHADGMQIFIGEESGYKPLNDCSLVTARYEVDGKVAGVLGVIGPTRMAYDRVIPIVDVTAKLLGAALKSR
ncbi:MAG: heat-inducible transcriptional repressor HrcA [Candidatus Sedimenticola endophacoides]|uniref:Heat-inducible transcription repressor HrcA n=1 Tax=Candidatus Sedimenticola endophacoides TaxID=2548426 RepID=A0A657Q1H7_9GAMM|nr:MAG: heat-inducible transcriptional repressor HrcA [Candidatus Sedimenticola endophacoides]OQX37161.1 MAG: heat-inducible transcriptional repressor HrcA [Candidatus Sedimenticola endophacoides]OQX39334.1 MAG: heat-inducible transcriptional repressor HrcA [Candidatus Sedimenticola endophacoides]OQX41516.1 MAG: heat-inducible transcriptional repressor HrcA [Candidatus Sedimenticola endophacoides]OQX45403.1 MAG: heat-inducible transcriptional repressor HrcA [Candidatus Sedimenticola endophacoid